MAKFMVYFDGGKYNGAERFYANLSTACRVASRYVLDQYRNSPESPCCEIYLVRPDSHRIFFQSIDIHSLHIC